MTDNRDTVAINNALISDMISNKGIKKEWLAASLGISRITLSRWVNGHVKTIKYQHLQLLSQHLDCAEHQLIQNKNNFDILSSHQDFFGQKTIQDSLSILGCEEFKAYSNKKMTIKVKDQEHFAYTILGKADLLVKLGHFRSAFQFYEYGRNIAEGIKSKKSIEKASIVNLNLKQMTDAPLNLYSFLNREMATNINSDRYLSALRRAKLSLYRTLGDFCLAKQEYALCYQHLNQIDQKEEEELLLLEGVLLFAEIANWREVERIILYGVSSEAYKRTKIWKSLSLIWQIRKNNLTDSASVVKSLEDLNSKSLKILFFALECLSKSNFLGLLKSIWPVLHPTRGLSQTQKLELRLMDLYVKGARNLQIKKEAMSIILQLRDLGLYKRWPLLKEKFRDILV